MPIPKPGETRKSPTDEYEIVQELNRGAFAIAFKAKSRRTGNQVFLKRYIDPKPSVDWYPQFVAHQKALKERVSSADSVQQYCYRFIDFFEAERHFFQCFEFIEGGMPLTDVIAGLTTTPAKSTWEQRVRFARVMMAGIAGLHSQRIVHTDLKPDNLLLIPNPHSAGEHFLRLIDMDWSLISDQLAPWHGKIGYVGTPGYQSPEHLSGKVPVEASDVFTCGIMLAELLGSGHPFAGGYEAAAVGGVFKPFRAERPIAKVPDMGSLEALVTACLLPDPSRRPSAVEVKDALLGRPVSERFRVTSVTSPVESKPVELTPRVEAAVVPPSPTPRRAPPASAPARQSRVSLQHAGNPVLSATIDTNVGRSHLKGAGPDYIFASDPQFRLYQAGGEWMVSHEPAAQNETIVNGKRLDSPMLLADGMRIAIGKSAKGIEKLPLIVQLST